MIFNGTARSEVFSGRSNDDRLYGNGGNDSLSGLVGDDLIEGGDGGDKLYGGAGSDRLDGGAGSDRIEGGAGADTLVGGEGHDHLEGGVGDDSMAGGTGNDLYFVDSLGDLVIELAGEGTDVVRTALNNWVLADNVEVVELQGMANLDVTGNAASSRLQGNGGDNRLSGMGGVDTLSGEDGDDILIGGTGNDLMRGGLGADVFMVLNESVAVPLETDQVYDFSAAEGDIIDLSGIDAIVGGGDDAFTLVGAFNKHAGQMTLTFAGGITTLRLDVTGDGRVDYQMKINGDVTGEMSDWLL